eukprot:477363-Amorphochlora_amoeboformis.AAC.1
MNFDLRRSPQGYRALLPHTSTDVFPSWRACRHDLVRGPLTPPHCGAVVLLGLGLGLASNLRDVKVSATDNAHGQLWLGLGLGLGLELGLESGLGLGLDFKLPGIRVWIRLMVRDGYNQPNPSPKSNPSEPQP